jgi:hypothetical protein
MKKLNQIKSHIQENRKVYLACGATAVVTAFAVLAISRKDASADLLQKVTQIGFRNEANPTIINLVERSTPSKPVHLVGTKLYFNSLSEASRETGHALSMLSKHINGHLPDLNGDVFELLEPAV